jgi:hypothetical protein
MMLVYVQVVQCLVMFGLLRKLYLIRLECLCLFYVLAFRCGFAAELSFGYFPLSRWWLGIRSVGYLTTLCLLHRLLFLIRLILSGLLYNGNYVSRGRCAVLVRNTHTIPAFLQGMYTLSWTEQPHDKSPE